MGRRSTGDRAQVRLLVLVAGAALLTALALALFLEPMSAFASNPTTSSAGQSVGGSWGDFIGLTVVFGALAIVAAAVLSLGRGP